MSHCIFNDLYASLICSHRSKVGQRTVLLPQNKRSASVLHLFRTIWWFVHPVQNSTFGICAISNGTITESSICVFQWTIVHVFLFYLVFIHIFCKVTYFYSHILAYNHFSHLSSFVTHLSLWHQNRIATSG